MGEYKFQIGFKVIAENHDAAVTTALRDLTEFLNSPVGDTETTLKDIEIRTEGIPEVKLKKHHNWFGDVESMA
jgi:hypothetical protein